MKLHRLAAGVALFLLATTGSSALAAAATQVPFHGRLEGSSDTSAFPMIVLHATGTATQVGQFAFVLPHVVNPADGTAVGTFELAASSEDRLVGTTAGVAKPTATPNVLFIVEIVTITGGTGRFAGATGGFTIEMLYDRLSLTMTGDLAGTLSAPGFGD